MHWCFGVFHFFLTFLLSFVRVLYAVQYCRWSVAARSIGIHTGTDGFCSVFKVGVGGDCRMEYL